MKECNCCNYQENFNVLFENETSVCIADENKILIGACYIIPKKHIASPFDLSSNEWNDMKLLLDQVKIYLDQLYHPDGYNLGWNINDTGGQFVFHSHLHIIPRYKDEPLAGKGIRHWLMQNDNIRPSLKGEE